MQRRMGGRGSGGEAAFVQWRVCSLYKKGLSSPLVGGQVSLGQTCELGTVGPCREIRLCPR